MANTFHVAVYVRDIPEAVEQYRKMLGIEPAKVKHDYAKFELQDPPVIFSLNVGGEPGTLSHLGIRYPGTGDVASEMVRVKQAFGVFILATAAYYGYLAYGLFADRWVDAKEVASSVEEKLKAGWHSSLADGLAVAAREQKPVLIDMWATWCKNCLIMDRTTLADPAVTTALESYVKIKFQAEQQDEEPARSVMERFKAIGLPTYVILKPKNTFTVPQEPLSSK